jgi:adenylate cyclase
MVRKGSRVRVSFRASSSGYLQRVAAEIERKFLLLQEPAFSEGSESVQIEQGYLAIDERAEVRVRRADREGLLTVKEGHGEVRDEVEIHLEEKQFEALWPLTDGRRLKKTRHLIPLEGELKVELDVFEDDLEGLVVAEIEFVDEDQSHRFDPPEWLGREITGDDRYAAQSLAMSGAPSV